MIVKCLPTGMLSSNCYILGSGGEGVVIDPGVRAAEVIQNLSAENLRLKYIILTHAHLDHIVSMDRLRKQFGVQVLIHRLDGGALGDPSRNGAELFGMDTIFEAADILAEHGEVYTVGGQRLEIIHTPGHTPGSICIKAGEMLFSGDTLFKLGIGRTDFEGGSMRDMLNSLENRLMILDDGVQVFPGHGPKTTIGYERSNNPYFR